ncbi:MAG: flagellar motor switch protein FliM [Chloroflexota bacterium]
MAKKQMAQWEIDALLQNVGGGTSDSGSGAADPAGVPARKAQPYDFRRPSRFSKDHFRVLQTVHEMLARNLASSLASYLRLNVRVQVMTVEQSTFDEYVEQLSNPTVIYVLRMPPLEGPVMVELSMAPTLAAIDRLLGGPGSATSPEPGLTEIERALLQPLGRHLLRATADAWHAVVPITPAIEDVILNPRAVRSSGRNEVIALLGLEFAVGDVTGTISLSLPYAALEPILGQLHTQVWNAERREREQPNLEELVRGQLLGVPLGLSVELGRVELPAASVLSLREGDVIRLDTSPQGHLALYVVDRPTFTCRAGLSAGNLAVQISG